MKRINRKISLALCFCLVQTLLMHSVAYAQEGLPEKYDLRLENQVTAVKDQGKTNYCWSYASMASLESSLIKSGLDSADFSENHMIAASRAYDIDIADGGNADMATAYFISGKGPVLEADETISAYYVGQIEYIEPRTGFLNNEDIKRAVMNSGAVYSSMVYNDGYFTEAYDAYYCDKLSKTGSHAVAIVGWDDNFAKENFGENQPLGDGAFICKNQYGESYGDQGYFYVSYYDYNIGKGENVVFQAMPNDFKYDNLYEHDPFGKTDYQTFGASATFANVYTVGQTDEMLTAVGFFTENENAGYEVYVVQDYKGPESLSLVEPVLKGQSSYSGYHTISIPAQVLEANSRFAVVVKLNGSSDAVAVESDVEGYASKATAGSDESYVLMNDGFKDLTTLNGFEESNVCLKAFTKNATFETDAFSIEEVKWSGLEKGQLAGLDLKVDGKRPEDQKICLLLCVYEQEGQFLKMVNSSYVEGDASPDNGLSLSVEALIPQTDDAYKLKAFVWEDGQSGQYILEDPFVVDIR